MKTIQQLVQFNDVTAEELFTIYMDSERHAEAVGAPATIESHAGGAFQVFGENKVRGRNLAIEPGRMIVQAWRAEPWQADDLDSIVTLTFTNTRGGAQIDLVQANVPDRAFEIIDGGWHQMYWKPWREYVKRWGHSPGKL